MEFEFVEIESCEQIGIFEDEYVYDIEVADESHTFIANNILVHNSLYLSYNQLLKTIKGYDKMTVVDKRDFLVKLNTEFLDKHNREFIYDYYASRYGKSVHNFELETVNYAGIWLNCKKKYAQLLLWHDKKVYTFDDMEMKNVGLEMKKPSYPRLSRNILSEVITYMLKNAGDPNLIFKMNAQVQQLKQKWNAANIDDICANMSINGYTKYILRDDTQLAVAPKCPPQVRAMGNYNVIMNKNGVHGEHLYSGKMKMYKFRSGRDNYDYFAYPAMEYPAWAEKYAPIDRAKMFQDYVLDPLNRILEPAGFEQLNGDGSVQFSLF